MPRRKKQAWAQRAVFGVPLPDGTYALGQAVALMMPNVVYCALTDERVSTIPTETPALSPESVISRVALTREQLDFGAWPVVGTAPLVSERVEFANERFASSGYVGAKMYDGALAEEFLAAFHALAPWDIWHDPQYLDSWLSSPERKPKRLLLKAKPSAS